MSFWAWVLVWLGVFVLVGEVRDWLWRRKPKPPGPTLSPTAWSKDVLSYYKHNSTKRTL